MDNVEEGICSTCKALNINDILDPKYFANVTPYGSDRTRPWQDYVRPVHRFTLASLTRGDFCPLCGYLRRVAYRVKDASIPRLMNPINLSSRASSFEDGNGFVLAAVPSYIVYHMADKRVQEAESKSPTAVFLLIIRGRDILERLADEAEQHRRDIAPHVIDQVVHYAKHRGTLISQDALEVPEIPSGVQYQSVKLDRIDFEVVKSWITQCTESHGQCKSIQLPVIPGMKLIDCQSRTIVKATPGVLYAALSYVWGKGLPEKYEYPSLPDNVPELIQNAMAVTKKLGIRYLWVDRYCIWQNDQIHKIGQVTRMDLIYGGATVTIVAAAGRDPNHGLPGIAGLGRAQLTQIKTQVSDKVLVSDFSYALQKERIERSTWKTRGWTFQEWVLSKRVLAFTDYRVSFHCLEGENIEQITHAIAIRDGLRQSSDHLRLQTPEGIKTLIFAYSKRKLTYGSDALHAVHGILTQWRTSNVGTGHVMGLPIKLPEPHSRNPTSMFLSLWDGLIWTLDLPSVRQGLRREGFPTWTWLAVEGSIQNMNRDLLAPLPATTLELVEVVGRARIEHDDGLVRDWEEFVESGELESPAVNSIVAIHLEGWCFMFGQFKRRKLGTQKVVVCLEVEESDRILIFYPDFGTAMSDSALQGQYEAISPYQLNDSRCALVFERVQGKQGAKRIGILQLLVWKTESSGHRHPLHLCNPHEAFDAKRGSVRLI